MSLFKNFDWSGKSVAKLIGIAILGLIALAVTISLISISLRTFINTGERDFGESEGFAYSREAGLFTDEFVSAPRISSFPIIPEPGFSTGIDAEDFEVKNYNGTIKTRKLDETCEQISVLKDREYVIFENSNRNDESCYYRFKVIKANEQEIVSIIKDLNPENFSAGISSIKKNIEGMDSELEILKKKLVSIEETLENAQKSYDSIFVIATRQQDAETLAKIIDSKLNLIDKLTKERLNISSRIERSNKRKADQLDRLDFTFFTINIYEDIIFDWKEIKNSWKFETKQVIRNINDVFQAISLDLITYLIRFAQITLYLFISVFLLKFVWIGVKKIWKGKWRK